MTREPHAIRLGPIARHGDIALYDCPCGCGLITSMPAQLCGCCGKYRSGAHWDSLYGCCDGCASCQSLGCDPCCHGECYPPLAASNARQEAAGS